MHRTGMIALAIGVCMPMMPASAQEPGLEARVAAVLRDAGGPGTRFGLVVVDEDGREIVAIAPDDRFMPASTTKMFTTAAVFATLPDIVWPDSRGGATVRLSARHGASDVIVSGNGDARLSSADACATDCLTTLADAVAARTSTVHDVVGDDSAFPDERWGLGMSWNNMATRSGTAISALSIDDNELAVTVSPGGGIGQRPVVAALPYYAIDNRATTVATGTTTLGYDRMPGDDRVRLTGTIAVGAPAERLRLGIDDPARYAAWRLRSLLERRGVRVTGTVVTRHRSPSPGDDPAIRNGTPAPRPPRSAVLARLMPPPLLADLRFISKVSQNVHAELLLRRLGQVNGSGSIADGVAAVRMVIDQSGVPRWAYDFADGSGMSSYNRVSPRGAVQFLRWTTTQAWGAAWRDTLPVGGVDGTLSRRFGGTALSGRLFAKTGSLNGTAALAGFLVAASGRTLTFAAYANDMPAGVSGARPIDAALLLIAAER